MKLYATTTSERASKGQGGNDYLHITLKDSTQSPTYFIGYWPNGTLVIEDIKTGKEVLRIEQKGKKKTGDHDSDLVCGHCKQYPCTESIN